MVGPATKQDHNGSAQYACTVWWEHSENACVLGMIKFSKLTQVCKNSLEALTYK